MRRDYIRAKAFCVVETDGDILVNVFDDPNTNEEYYRPLGGSIEFGEYSHAAVQREFQEEIDAELTNLQHLDTLENIFDYGGEMAHELVAVYDAEFVDKSLYEVETIQGYEEEIDKHFTAVWKPIVDFKAGDGPLYPDGLLKLLTKTVV